MTHRHFFCGVGIPLGRELEKKEEMLRGVRAS